MRLMMVLRQAIVSGTLPPGTPLPPEREIAALSGLSRVTVRKAVAPLVADGLIQQKRGFGTIVSQPRTRVEQSLSLLTSFSEDMERRGVEVRSVVLACTIGKPSPDEEIAFALNPHEEVARLHRLRLAGEMPLALERAALPQSVLPKPSEVGASLYEHLATTGHRPTRAIQRISAVLLAGSDAKHLGLQEGAAGLRIVRTSYLPSGRVVELTHSVYRADAYDFIAELRLSPAQDVV